MHVQASILHHFEVQPYLCAMLSTCRCLLVLLRLAHSPIPLGGTIGEFVNPKYKDASKTAFKSSTRLECMMQDYPKALPADARVGFTVVNQVSLCMWWCREGDSANQRSAMRRGAYLAALQCVTDRILCISLGPPGCSLRLCFHAACRALLCCMPWVRVCLPVGLCQCG